MTRKTQPHHDLSPDMHYLQRELYDLQRADNKIFEFLQQGALDGVWYWNLENTEEEWMSPQFWLTMGYDPTKRAHLSTEWQDLIHPDDLELALENFRAHLNDPNHPYDQIVRYAHANGSTVWVRCRGLIIRDEDGVPRRMLGVHTDVTALKQRERDLEQREQELLEAQQTLQRFIMRHTHDMRNPLHALKLMLENIQAQMDPLTQQSDIMIADDHHNQEQKCHNPDPKVLPHQTQQPSGSDNPNESEIFASTNVSLRNINRQHSPADQHRQPATKPASSTPNDVITRCLHTCQQLNQQINHLLEYGSLQSGSQRPQYEQFNVDDLVYGIANQFEDRCRLAGVRFQLHAETSETICFQDIVRLTQVIANVIDNALKFTSQGGFIGVQIEIDRSDPQELQLRCVVRDTGVGIAPERLPRVFAPFETFPDGSSTKGYGLGLAICQQIMTMLQGTISLESLPQQGTTVTMVAPAIVVTDTTPSQELYDQANLSPHALGALPDTHDSALSSGTSGPHTSIATPYLSKKAQLSQQAAEQDGTSDYQATQAHFQESTEDILEQRPVSLAGRRVLVVHHDAVAMFKYARILHEHGVAVARALPQQVSALSESENEAVVMDIACFQATHQIGNKRDVSLVTNAEQTVLLSCLQALPVIVVDEDCSINSFVTNAIGQLHGQYVSDAIEHPNDLLLALNKVLTLHETRT